jgi:hypothetical protein
MFTTIATKNYDDLPDLVSVSKLTYHNIRMHRYDSNCTSQMNWFDLAGTTCLVFEPEPLNAIESIKAILAATFEEEPVEAYFWEQSAVPSPWNTYWTDAAREGGGLDINDAVCGPHWIRYS